jgi:hypothetical protein
MELKTNIWGLSKGKYANLTELARAMGVHPSHIYRVKRGECRINETFIVGAIKAFPGYKLTDLFYVAPDGSQND